MDKRYKVAAGRAVTAQGVVFGPGAVLPAEALSAESVQILLKGKIIVEAGSEAKAAAPAVEKKAEAEAAAPAVEKKAEAEAPAQAEKTANEEAAPKGDDKKRK